MMKDISLDIRYVRGVGPKMAALFNKIGIQTVKELLFYPPFRYLNREIDKENIKPNEYNTLIADIVETGEMFTRNRKRIFNALAKSNDEYIYLKWFNNKYISNVLKTGQKIIVSGKVKPGRGIYEMLHPVYEILNDEDTELIHTGRIVPVYHLTDGLSQRYLRRTMHYAVKEFSENADDSIPEILQKKYDFIPIKEAIENLHYPINENLLEQSLRRMKYNELYEIGLLIADRRRKNRKKKKHTYRELSGLSGKLLSSLSFKLTDDQQQALSEINSDLMKPQAMNRMLMGDVGVGKTIVALLAILNAVENGYQTALMAPTEVLAQQHYKIIRIIRLAS